MFKISKNSKSITVTLDSNSKKNNNNLTLFLHHPLIIIANYIYVYHYHTQTNRAKKEKKSVFLLPFIFFTLLERVNKQIRFETLFSSKCVLHIVFIDKVLHYMEEEFAARKKKEAFFNNDIYIYIFQEGINEIETFSIDIF